ncbi:MAG TPA: hypothetical protein VGK92_08930 [Gaiellales bacterium]
MRTRVLGRALLPVAHAGGVRHLAMEALWDRDVASRANASRTLERGLDGYLGQPEMIAFVDAALALGWTLHGYEADVEVLRAPGQESNEAVNRREDAQARNLGAIVDGLPVSAKVLGWCGNGHLSRHAMTASMRGETVTWTPMGSLVAGYCGVEPFSLDQTVTVDFGGRELGWLRGYEELLRGLGGSAGCLAGDQPEELAWLGDGADAYVLSLDNELTQERGEST